MIKNKKEFMKFSRKYMLPRIREIENSKNWGVNKHFRHNSWNAVIQYMITHKSLTSNAKNWKCDY